MGLLSTLKKKKWREDFAGAAFFDARSETVQSGGSRVCLVDYLMRYMNHDRERLWTLRELAAKLCGEAVQDAFTTVVICDDKRYVSKFKAAEQEDRAEGRAKTQERKGKDKAIPYPADAHFTEHGIAYTDEDGDAIEDGIDLNRLSLSRWYGNPDDPKRCSNLGNTLWHDMHGDLQEHLQKRGEHSQEVIFHHDANLGPVRFTTLRCPEDGTWETHRQTGTFEPMYLGETDTSMLQWTAKYDGEVDAIDWRTGDSDLIALYCLYHSRRTYEQRMRTRIWWHCEYGVAVDLCMLVELTLNKSIQCDDYMPHKFQSAEAIALYAIFCGTDFIKHKNYAHGCAEDKMLVAFIREDLAVTRDTPVQPIFERFLRRLHYTRLTGKPVLVANNDKPATPLPSIAALRRMHEAKAPKLAKERAARHKKSCADLVQKYAARMQPIRARQAESFDDMAELASTTEILRGLQVELDEELTAKNARFAEDAWEFPSDASLTRDTQILQWVFDYWSKASLGIFPTEPVLVSVDDEVVSCPSSPDSVAGQKRKSPHLSPLLLPPPAAASEAASSEPSKRKRS